MATRSAGPKPRGRKRRIVRTEPSSASGGTTTLTREPSGSRASQSGSASSTRRPERAEDPLDRVAQVGLPREARARRLDAAVALDPHAAGAVDHDLVDAGVGEQRLERPEPERALGDPRRQPRAGIVVEQTGLAVDELADALVQVAAGVAGGLAEQPVAQRDRQLVERGVAIGVVHALYRRGGRKFAPL